MARRRTAGAQLLADGNQSEPDPVEEIKVIEAPEEPGEDVVVTLPQDDGQIETVRREPEASAAAPAPDEAVEAIRRENQALRSHIAETSKYLSQNELQKQRDQVAAAEWQLREASERYDSAAMARAQSELTREHMRLMQMEQTHAAVIAQTAAPDGPDGQFEREIVKYSPASQAWIRKHKDDLLSSQARAGLAQAAHDDALRRGLPVDSDAYFDAIDQIMGYRDMPDASSPRTSSRKANARSYAAPASRSSFGSDAPRGDHQIVLSERERDAAQMFWPDKTPQAAWAEYARNKAAINANAGKRYGLQWSATKYKGVVER